MAEFQNTIDLLGDEVVTKALVEKTITEFHDDALRGLGNSAFRNCSVLTNVNLPNVTGGGANVFDNCSSLTVAHIPNLTNIGNYMFNNCSSLSSANFPLVTSVGNSSFSGCKSLKNVDLPLATNASAGTSGCFSGCGALKNIKLPVWEELVTSMFSNCSSLESVDTGATNIESCFDGCTSLKTVILRSETLCSLSNANAFGGAYKATPFYSGMAGGTIIAPRAIVMEYPNATNWSVVIARNTKNRVLALEDYTVDGTITGEIDWDKLNGGN